MNYTSIILGAGSGSRMKLNYNKMFYEINNKPIIVLSILNFINDPLCNQIIIVVNELEREKIEETLNKHHVLTNKCIIVNGGSQRQYSVYNGLKDVINEIVLVHDGARPFITQQLMNQLVREAQIHNCAIPGVRVKDTIKKVEDGFIKETIPRENLYAVQTPQAIKTNIIKKAHQYANEEHYLGTDEASLIEKYFNFPVKIVPSTYDNIKLTTKEDLIQANYLYQKYFQ